LQEVHYEAPKVRIVFRRIERPTASYLLLAAILAGFAVQLIAKLYLGKSYFEFGNHGSFLYYVCPARSTVLSRPWTLVTSIFAHGGVLHLLVNVIVFVSFAPLLEMRVGRRDFLLVFFTSGVIAAAAQVAASPPEVVVLGASGAILGLLAALAVLAPRLPVLFLFIIPMHLWMIVGGFAAISALLAFTMPESSVANLAHFTGIIVGVVWGLRIKEREADLVRLLTI
jgi:membrane associated rhomboid family serine protease